MNLLQSFGRVGVHNFDEIVVVIKQCTWALWAGPR